MREFEKEKLEDKVQYNTVVRSCTIPLQLLPLIIKKVQEDTIQYNTVAKQVPKHLSNIYNNLFSNFYSWKVLFTILSLLYIVYM